MEKIVWRAEPPFPPERRGRGIFKVRSFIDAFPISKALKITYLRLGEMKRERRIEWRSAVHQTEWSQSGQGSPGGYA